MIRRSTLRSIVVCSTTALVLAMSAGVALARGTVPPEGSEPAVGLTPIETIGLFVLLPLAIFALIALAVLGPSMGKGARHRTGDGLGSTPVWVADRTIVDEPVLGDPAADAASSDSGPRGGASGRW